MASATELPFGTRLIGETEKALNAILRRLLAGSGVGEPQWVTLNVAIAAGGALDEGALAGRLAQVRKVTGEDARARLRELEEHGLLTVLADGGPVVPTAAGLDFRRRVAARVEELTARLWGDRPEAELAAAGALLNTVLARANKELAGP
ncbi:MarR family transcriptional regulator [Streptomyces hoynatensis]|uniref:MarR family transcriptional regulator n=1 Tax=Streptomyces hoynatensis TaxID=1141874 RepID=A0A3A9ZC74_9ACTN|nr:MarR family transcriptional regulator [Streptomyces hoynatensis]RKN44966.1 MarR family transcriptional regulator [Streptomyces hoynatensis]